MSIEEADYEDNNILKTLFIHNEKEFIDQEINELIELSEEFKL